MSDPDLDILHRNVRVAEEGKNDMVLPYATVQWLVDRCRKADETDKELERIYALPEEEWLSVQTFILQYAAQAARAGFNGIPVKDALDRASTYVKRLVRKKEKAEAEVIRLREGK